MNLESTASHNPALLQQLQEEHRRYSEQLEGLLQSSYPSVDEQLEEIRLKKLKLRIKDRIAGNDSSLLFMN